MGRNPCGLIAQSSDVRLVSQRSADRGKIRSQTYLRVNQIASYVAHHTSTRSLRETCTSLQSKRILVFHQFQHSQVALGDSENYGTTRWVSQNYLTSACPRTIRARVKKRRKKSKSKLNRTQMTASRDFLMSKAIWGRRISHKIKVLSNMRSAPSPKQSPLGPNLFRKSNKWLFLISDSSST